MKSKVEGRNYIVLNDDDKFPVKINRKRLDKSLIDIVISLKKIQFLMKTLYETDYDTYRFLLETVFKDSVFEFDEGTSYRLDDLVSLANDTQDYLLTHTDEIKPREKIETLEDLGYKYYGLGHMLYEKLLLDTDTEELTEEILEIDGKMYRRIRKTIWEKTSYGKSSDNITYKKIGNTKRLIKAYLNSKAQFEEKGNC